MKNLNGASSLRKLRSKLNNRQNFLNALDGQQVDLDKAKVFVQGPFLHQDTPEMLEEESAQLEEDMRSVHPNMFNWFRQLRQTIYKNLK